MEKMGGWGKDHRRSAGVLARLQGSGRGGTGTWPA